jgi:hypothetical protein
MPEYELYDGDKSTGIVVAPDSKYPAVYRIHWPDRPLSDMVNLTRAKDAAMRWAARQGSRGNRLNWKRREKPLEAPPVSQKHAGRPQQPSTGPAATKHLQQPTMGATGPAP